MAMTVRLLVLASALLAGLASCVPPRATYNGVQMSVDDAARAQLDAARAKERAGDLAKAAELYEDLARRFPRADEADEALFGAGGVWEKLGKPLKARAAYETLLDRYPRSDKARLAEARISALGGGSDRELELAREAYGRLPEGQKLQRADELAQAAEKSGDADAALFWRKEAVARATTPAQRDRAQEALRRLVEGLSAVDVERLADREDGSSPAAPLLSWQLALVHQQHRDWDALERALSSFLSRYPDHTYAAKARTLRDSVGNRGVVEPLNVGVVLPLSGPYKAFGQQLLDGIELATKGSGIRLIVRDDKGEPTDAAAAVERLFFEDHVIGILGGVLVTEAQAAAAKADELGIPIVSFSRAEKLVEGSEWVFRDMLTNGEMAEALASFAIERRGMRRFAILYPEIPYGTELRDLFDEHVSRHGGEIRGTQSYADKATTFSDPIRKLVGKENVTGRAEYQRKLAEIRAQNLDARKYRNAVEKMRNSISPRIDFDALFIPDQWRQIALVAPALAFEDVITSWCDAADVDRTRRTTGQDVKPVMLLGANLWNHPELPTRAGKYVNCSVFVDGFHAGSERPEVARFVESFQHAKGRNPGLLEAYGFEASQVMRSSIEADRPTSRRALVDSLLRARDLPGPMGPTSVTGDRELRHPLFFLFIDNGTIREAHVDSPDGAL
ncbi:penicillin-binding protein activator [Vulgatibacter incomptus]|uniref:Branched-chain amino acid ABC transporter, amino acid-binding protein n=1 Tax=Vulgatibacter incomptus TaxID=1391653 RepID=A0A0K1PI02_9BACT|nr:penicillin-binding protein activator [Vulgatibacter incomptus]AKU93036.1 Branched-chain amino acid ABC transporter, amino acid-binding protein [Vulgatibacter incomptus]